MIVEQHVTDMVDVTDLPHGISRLSFAFETSKPRSLTREVFYARTSQVRAVLADHPDQPVTALADPDLVTPWVPLNPECTESIFTDVPLRLFGTLTWRGQGGMPHPLADPATFTGEVTPQTLVRVERDETLYSFATDQPVSTAQIVDGYTLSARHWDLDALAALLQDHPWVKSLYFRKAHGWEDTYVAPELIAVLVLPQDAYEAAHAAAQDPDLPAHGIGEVLFDLPRYGMEVPGLGADPLGALTAKRATEFQTPSDGDCHGDGFVAEERYELAASLPNEWELFG